MSVSVIIIEHMNEYITPVAAPGTDEPPEQAPRPAERLEAELCLLAGNLAAATCRFLELVGEYDASKAWASWDMRSCAEWLSWRCQIAPGTAREHVRVARALRTLPVTHGEFAAGRMGYSKVREITRIATPATEAGLVEMMSPMTAGQAERFARAYRSCEQDQPGGSLHLPPADGAVVLQALRAATGDLDRQDGGTPAAGSGAGEGQPVPDLTGDGWPAPFLAAVTDLAAALVAICGGYLGGKIAAADNADIYQVHIHATAEALTPAVPAGTPDLPAGHPAHPDRCHLEDGPAINPGLAQRIACFATLSVIVHGTDGTIAAVGRRSRKIPAALRRAVRERDGYRCTFPGCSTRRTEAHHILYWSLGQRLDLHFAIWVALHNARTAQDRYDQDHQAA
jgi:hypothetical protein